MAIQPARLDADLRTNPYLRGHRADPRLVDPSLARAFDEVAVSVREDARREGFDAGYAAGLASAQADSEQAREEVAQQSALHATAREDQLRAALDLVASAAQRLDDERSCVLGSVADDLVSAAFSLARQLIGRELDLAANPGIDAIRRALLVAPADGDVTVRLNPRDADVLDDLPGITGGRAVRVTPDPSIARGDCLADVGATRIDARIATALARVEAVIAS